MRSNHKIVQSALKHEHDCDPMHAFDQLYIVKIKRSNKPQFLKIGKLVYIHCMETIFIMPSLKISSVLFAKTKSFIQYISSTIEHKK